MNNRNEELNIKAIKEPLKKYLKTDEPEDFFGLIISIHDRMNDGGTVLSPMKTEPRIVIIVDPDKELEEVLPSDKGPVRRSGLIEEEDGAKWLPLFTDASELSKGRLAKSTILEDRPIRDVVVEAFENGDLAGLVINPYSDALSFRKEILYVILHLDDVDLSGDTDDILEDGLDDIFDDEPENEPGDDTVAPDDLAATTADE